MNLKTLFSVSSSFITYQIDLEIDFMDSVQGIVRNLTYERKELCKECSGTGGSNVRCAKCKGKGQFVLKRGPVVRSFVCEECEGAGVIIGTGCKYYQDVDEID